MAEMNEDQLAGTSAAPVATTTEAKPVKEINPVRFYDGSRDAVPTSLDLRPGVTQAIRPTEPRAVTVNPDGSLAGSPNLLPTDEEGPVATGDDASGLSESGGSSTPTQTGEEIKAPAKD